ncbi:DUSP [Mytilus coruscus]|uniref:protein-tyrosine-phosphatase n=1 Tax=Mytilus coruscus TaxID=42192 RepID=A0A6J8B856_MYTCO|nr:DUSP [Mytilus coruscus]
MACLTDKYIEGEWMYIENIHLAELLKKGLEKVLLIDSRSFLEYNTSRIQQSVNVCCSKLTKHRLQQDKISIKELMAQLCHIEIEEYSDIVVYDQCTSDITHLTEDNFLVILLRKLKMNKVFKSVALLTGGYLTFSAMQPKLCESKSDRCKALTFLSQPCLPVSSVGPTHILPFLYLGSYRDAISQDIIQVNDISYILNVSTTCPQPPFIQEGHFFRIPVNDNYSAKMLPFFEEAFQFIDKIREANGCVLIHCLAGISRSPTLAIAYIMKHLKMSSDDAYRYVKDKRPTISPNFNFLGQLLEYEKQVKHGFEKYQHDGHTLDNKSKSIAMNLQNSPSSPRLSKPFVCGSLQDSFSNQFNDSLSKNLLCDGDTWADFTPINVMWDNAKDFMKSKTEGNKEKINFHGLSSKSEVYSILEKPTFMTNDYLEIKKKSDILLSSSPKSSTIFKPPVSVLSGTEKLMGIISNEDIKLESSELSVSASFSLESPQNQVAVSLTQGSCQHSLSGMMGAEFSQNSQSGPLFTEPPQHSSNRSFTLELTQHPLGQPSLADSVSESSTIKPSPLSVSQQCSFESPQHSIDQLHNQEILHPPFSQPCPRQSHLSCSQTQESPYHSVSQQSIQESTQHSGSRPVLLSLSTSIFPEMEKSEENSANQNSSYIIPGNTSKSNFTKKVSSKCFSLALSPCLPDVVKTRENMTDCTLFPFERNCNLKSVISKNFSTSNIITSSSTSQNEEHLSSNNQTVSMSFHSKPTFVKEPQTLSSTSSVYSNETFPPITGFVTSQPCVITTLQSGINRAKKPLFSLALSKMISADGEHSPSKDKRASENENNANLCSFPRVESCNQIQKNQCLNESKQDNNSRQSLLENYSIPNKKKCTSENISPSSAMAGLNFSETLMDKHQISSKVLDNSSFVSCFSNMYSSSRTENLSSTCIKHAERQDAMSVYPPVSNLSSTPVTSSASSSHVVKRSYEKRIKHTMERPNSIAFSKYPTFDLGDDCQDSAILSSTSQDDTSTTYILKNNKRSKQSDRGFCSGHFSEKEIYKQISAAMGSAVLQTKVYESNRKACSLDDMLQSEEQKSPVHCSSFNRSQCIVGNSDGCCTSSDTYRSNSDSSGSSSQNSLHGSREIVQVS